MLGTNKHDRIIVAMSSVLVTGGTLEDRKKFANNMLTELELRIENNPDILILNRQGDKKSVGIGEAKKATKWLSEKPFKEKYKVLIVENAKDLTTEAQNSLLKTLEEPPEYAEIVLLTQSKADVLQTILSRCKRQELSNKQLVMEDIKSEINDKEQNSVNEILRSEIGEKFSWALEAGKMDRENLIQILNEWIVNVRKLMLENQTDNQLAKTLENIIMVKKDLEETNINQKLAIETLLLNI